MITGSVEWKSNNWQNNNDFHKKRSFQHSVSNIIHFNFLLFAFHNYFLEESYLVIFNRRTFVIAHSRSFSKPRMSLDRVVNSRLPTYVRVIFATRACKTVERLGVILMRARFLVHVIRDMPKNIGTCTRRCFTAFGRERRQGRKERNIGKKVRSKRERPVVKKDFPTIYLHLRAINNSRVRACPRRTLEKNCVNASVGLLFRRPFKEAPATE